MSIYPESLPFPKTTFWLHIMVCSLYFPLTHRVIYPQLEREHPMAVLHKQNNVGWKNKSLLHTPTNVLPSKNNNLVSSVIYKGHQWNIGDGPNCTCVTPLSSLSSRQTDPFHPSLPMESTSQQCCQIGPDFPANLATLPASLPAKRACFSIHVSVTPLQTAGGGCIAH